MYIRSTFLLRSMMVSIKAKLNILEIGVMRNTYVRVLGSLVTIFFSVTFFSSIAPRPLAVRVVLAKGMKKATLGSWVGRQMQ